jgi:hypothetical protein
MIARFMLGMVGAAGSFDFEYNIGDTGPAGGIIFYRSRQGFFSGPTQSDLYHYLEAWTSDVDGGSGVPWSGNTSTLVGTSTSLDAGYKNTVDAVAQNSTANRAITLSRLSRGGFSDWFLPSKDELFEMWSQRAAIGGFASDVYWSSSEFNGTSVWRQLFPTGTQNTQTKTTNAKVRPIRGF